MEKGYLDLTDATLKEFYRPLISRMVANYVVRRLAELSNHYPHNTPTYLQKLHNGEYCKVLHHSLDYLWNLKDDCITEILTQNNVHTGEMATMYHDRLKLFLHREILSMKQMIRKINTQH